MARLLIVSRSMALAMRLADQHDVTEHPVDDLEALGTDLDADVLVLDIGDPMQAVTTVNRLREAGQVTPVLLVSGYQPEWEQVEAQEVDGVVVVPLPITRAALLAGIAQLTDSPEAVLDFEADQADQHDIEEPASEPADGPGTNGHIPGDAAQHALNGTMNGPAASEANSTGEGDSDDGGNEDDKGDEDGDRASDESDVNGGPGSPPWGSPLMPGGISSFGRPATQTAAPPSPPWGETVHVGPPAAEGATGVSPGEATPDAGRTPQIPALAAGQAVQQALSEQNNERGPDTGSQTAVNTPTRRLPRLGNRPRKLQRRPNINDSQGLGLVTDPLGPRTDPYGVTSGNTGPSATVGTAAGASALDRRLDSDAAALIGERGARARSASGIVMRPADLVQSLLDQVGDLYGVCDTAQVLADDVIERADADAAAILVPDGPVWRVSGGVGLRPLERRLILESTHWLITEIGSAGRAVLIDDTDIIRPQLAGAPLAAWRHLLAVPVPDVRAIVVLARGQEAGPFTDRDLAAVIAPVREAAALLAQAVQTRRLARALSSLREADTDAPPRRRDS